LNSLLERCRGKNKLAKTLLEKFQTQIDLQVKEMNGCPAGDLSSLARLAHTTRGRRRISRRNLFGGKRRIWKRPGGGESSAAIAGVEELLAEIPPVAPIILPGAASVLEDQTQLSPDTHGVLNRRDKECGFLLRMMMWWPSSFCGMFSWMRAMK